MYKNRYLNNEYYMAENFKLTIEYDGTRYHGWQRQKNDRTIQGEIEKALLTMTGKKITLTGSGRTDAGVHALGQIANFHCRTELDSDVFLKGLNSLLQKDIVIRECCQVEEKFHARFDAKSKTYHYRILNRKIPTAVCRQYAWHIRSPLDLDAMQSALGHIIGTHDFRAFENICFQSRAGVAVRIGVLCRRPPRSRRSPSESSAFYTGGAALGPEQFGDSDVDGREADDEA